MENGTGLDRLFAVVRDLYTEHERLALVLAGGLLTWALTKFLPWLSRTLLEVLLWALGLVSGRCKRRTIIGKYLNWVVLQNQDLNLTGVVGHGHKPKLEQIFLSLQLQPTDSTVGQGSAELTRTRTNGKLRQIIDRVTTNSFTFARRSRWYRRSMSGTRRPANCLLPILFSQPLFPRTRQWAHRYLLSVPAVIVGLSGPFVIWPIASLFAFAPASSVGSALAGFFATCSVAIGIASIRDRQNRPPAVIVTIFVLLPLLVVSAGLFWRINHGNSIPIAFPLAVGVALLIALSIAVSNDYVQEPQAKELGQLLESDHIAILGKPGSGKSTYIQFVALTLARQRAGDRQLRKRGIAAHRFGTSRWLMPIAIPLRKVSSFLDQADPNIVQNLLIEGYRQRVLPSSLREVCTQEFFTSMLKRRRCILLLDGLDEVSDDGQFKAVIREVLGLISEYPGNKVLITSRYAGWRGGVGGAFKTFEVEDLNPQQIALFIRKWYTSLDASTPEQKSQGNAERLHRIARSSERASELENAMTTSPSLRSLSVNPLLLSIICFVHSHKALPEERLSLYKECSNLLLVQWDREKGIPVDDTNLTLTRKEAILQEIAFSLHSGKIGSRYGRKEASREELIPIVAQVIARFGTPVSDAGTLFEKLVSRSGVLVAIERFAGKYAFSHLTFQEFYAAEYIFSNNLDPFAVSHVDRETASYGMTSWWSEVLALYGAMTRDGTSVIKRLIGPGIEDRFGRRLRLAAQCISESVELDQAVSDGIVKLLRCVRFEGGLADDLQEKCRRYLLRFSSRPEYFRSYIRWRCDSTGTGPDQDHLARVLGDGLNSAESSIQHASISGLIRLWDRAKVLPPDLRSALLCALESKQERFQWYGLTYVVYLGDNAPSEIAATAGDVFLKILERASRDISSREGATFDHPSVEPMTDSRGPWEEVPREIENTIHSMPRVLRRAANPRYASVLWSMLATVTGRQLSGFVIGPMVFHTLSGMESDLAVDLARVFIAVASRKERTAARTELERGLRDGSSREQAIAVKLLYVMFRDNKHIVEAVLACLNSKHSIVRRATVLTLADVPHSRYWPEILPEVTGWLKKRRTPGMLATYWSDRGTEGRAKRTATLHEEVFGIRLLLGDKLNGDDSAVRALLQNGKLTNEYVDRLIDADAEDLRKRLCSIGEGVLGLSELYVKHVRALNQCGPYMHGDDQLRAAEVLARCAVSGKDELRIAALAALRDLCGIAPNVRDVAKGVAVELLNHPLWAMANGAADLLLAAYGEAIPETVSGVGA